MPEQGPITLEAKVVNIPLNNGSLIRDVIYIVPEEIMRRPDTGFFNASKRVLVTSFIGSKNHYNTSTFYLDDSLNEAGIDPLMSDKESLLKAAYILLHNKYHDRLEYLCERGVPDCIDEFFSAKKRYAELLGLETPNGEVLLKYKKDTNQRHFQYWISQVKESIGEAVKIKISWKSTSLTTAKTRLGTLKYVSEEMDKDESLGGKTEREEQIKLVEKLLVQKEKELRSFRGTLKRIEYSIRDRLGLYN